MSRISGTYVKYSDWKLWNTKLFGTYNRKEHYYYKKLLQPYFKRAKWGFAVLEIGFGNGSIAGWLASNYQHISWTGIEVQDSLVSKAQKAGFDAFSDISLVPKPEQFDAIIAIDVLEHMGDQDIKKLFSIFETKVKQDGVIIARVPNAAGPLGLPNQTGDPTHINQISQPRLESYLLEWEIDVKGDILPIWTGNPLSMFRNICSGIIRFFITRLVRFAFAPQPRTILSSNIHLIMKKK